MKTIIDEIGEGLTSLLEKLGYDVINITVSASCHGYMELKRADDRIFIQWDYSESNMYIHSDPLSVDTKQEKRFVFKLRGEVIENG